MAEFSPEQTQVFKKHFNEFTISEHGYVTIKEVGMVLIVLGEYVSSYTILDMMKEMGLDENSFIKFNDFLEIYRKVLEEKKELKLRKQAERAKKLVEEQSVEGTQPFKAVGLSQEQIEHVRKQFNRYGDYGNGRITYIDIGLLMMDLNEEHFVTSYEVQDMIKAMGLVVDNTFDFKEFLEEKKVAKKTKDNKLAAMKGAFEKPSAKGTQMAEFSPVEIEEIRPHFDQYDDAEGNGRITFTEIGMLMSSLEVLVPAFKIQEMIKEMDLDENGTFEFREFLVMYWTILDNKLKVKLQPEAEKTIDIFSSPDEEIAFVGWINYQLKEDPEVKTYLPLSKVGGAIFDALKDGIILCKLINKSVPNTVDERAINKTKLPVYSIMQENQMLALNSAASIGCNITNIGPQDIMVGRPNLILDLLWQIIKIGLFNKISLPNSLNLPFLLQEGENYSNLLAISPEEILFRWFNLQLQRAGSTRTVHNFSEDIKDSECYTILLNQIAPKDSGVDMSSMNESDLDKRAEHMLNQAHKIGCKHFVRPKDVVKGNECLNLAFVANLFNKAPGVRPPPLGLFVEEPHMEKSFRNWMNSVGVTPFVNNIFVDLRDGLVLLQLFDMIYPGLVVDWDKVNKAPFKIDSGNRKKIENCDYAIELAQKLQFTITGVSGQDIREGNPTFILAVVWETMRAYTLSVLQKLDRAYQPMGDLDILGWVNTLLGVSGKGTQNIRSFEDPILASSITVLDVVASLKSDSVDYYNVGYGTDEKTMLSNAKYAISMSRKIGACVYVLPEDLIEPNPKMYFTVFVSLLIAARLML